MCFTERQIVLTCETPGCQNKRTSPGLNAKGVKRYLRYCKGCWRARRGRPRSGKVSHCAVKRRAVEFLGGKCMNPACPVVGDLPPAAFDFHHRNPAEKTSSITVMLHQWVGWGAIVQELGKCDLLCCLCHRLIHSGNNHT